MVDFSSTSAFNSSGGFGATALFSGGISSISGGVGSLFQAGASQSSAQQQYYNSLAAQQQSSAALASATAYQLQGQGDILEGQVYGTAATLATTNAAYTEQSTAIQTAQAQRQLYMTLGTQKATAAGAGGTGGGSAADILRSSASQGALNTSVLQQQGLITEAGYTEQAAAYTLQQQAASVSAQAQNASATGEEATAQAYQDTAKSYLAAQQAAEQQATAQETSGAVSIGTGIAQLAALGLLLSDIALKTDIELIGKYKLLNVYSYRYLWDEITTRHIGFIAQEVEAIYPDAVFSVGGFKAVNYPMVMHAAD